ncbi:sugar transferase [Hymenobacter psoromatis]|uniref:sugar transferase n=1 Tax=Hymenobacter psoromatis TaxID=1484116 RepID=UPI001CC0B4BD|nr:sugar transferase [Hymenobacter psoromatis]
MRVAAARLRVLLLAADAQAAAGFQDQYAPELDVVVATTPGQALAAVRVPPPGAPLAAIVNATDPGSPLGLRFVYELRQRHGQRQPILWLAPAAAVPALRELLLAVSGSDVVAQEAGPARLLARLAALVRPQPLPPPAGAEWQMPLAKRVLDVVVASSALVVLAPFFLLVGALIKLESRGPVFYYSYRVGAGYRVFKFWKLRSMRSDADQLLATMAGLNQYQPAAGPPETAAAWALCAACAAAGSRCLQPLIDGRGEVICERWHRQLRQAAAAPAFVKIVNDPRVTRMGHFLRNSSIDELPQLYNVLRGEMSLVGNRPLPLYEAEKLLTDAHARRFLAPAGITGLWQVSRRGRRGPLSDDERKALDNEYARDISFWKDVKILLRTIPALFQRENV